MKVSSKTYFLIIIILIILGSLIYLFFQGNLSLKLDDEISQKENPFINESAKDELVEGENPFINRSLADEEYSEEGLSINEPFYNEFNENQSEEF